MSTLLACRSVLCYQFSEQEAVVRPFYVKAILNSRGRVVAYGVFEVVDGAEAERNRFPVENSADVALHLANALRDDLNNAVS